MIPDALALTIGYLSKHPAVVAFHADIRTELNGDFSRPTVKVTQLDAEDRAEHLEYLTAFLIQLDCYSATLGPAGTGQASLLNRTVRAAMFEMPGIHGDTVVKAVRFGVNPQIPDPAWDPPRQRWTLEAWVYTHGV